MDLKSVAAKNETAKTENVEDDIMKGKSLQQALQQFKIYPFKMIQLVKVGEETNQLDHFFGKISEQYIEEVEYKTTLSSMMEPFIIIFFRAHFGRYSCFHVFAVVSDEQQFSVGSCRRNLKRKLFNLFG